MTTHYRMTGMREVRLGDKEDSPIARLGHPLSMRGPALKDILHSSDITDKALRSEQSKRKASSGLASKSKKTNIIRPPVKGFVMSSSVPRGDTITAPSGTEIDKSIETVRTLAAAHAVTRTALTKAEAEVKRLNALVRHTKTVNSSKQAEFSKEQEQHQQRVSDLEQEARTYRLQVSTLKERQTKFDERIAQSDFTQEALSRDGICMKEELDKVRQELDQERAKEAERRADEMSLEEVINLFLEKVQDIRSQTIMTAHRSSRADETRSSQKRQEAIVLANQKLEQAINETKSSSEWAGIKSTLAIAEAFVEPHQFWCLGLKENNRLELGKATNKAELVTTTLELNNTTKELERMKAELAAKQGVAKQIKQKLSEATAMVDNMNPVGQGSSKTTPRCILYKTPLPRSLFAIPDQPEK